MTNYGRIAFWMSFSWMLFTVFVFGSVAYASFTAPYPVIQFFVPHIIGISILSLFVFRAWKDGQRIEPIMAILCIVLIFYTVTWCWYMHQMQPNGRVKVSDVRWL